MELVRRTGEARRKTTRGSRRERERERESCFIDYWGRKETVEQIDYLLQDKKEFCYPILDPNGVS